ncbi:hypothetical protein BAE44_0024000 [Dichanthelium oligosanthes]|uniref:Uncharacterized protein n=1 Tax=Dichanthelium oligosanthes TaxID=888268 RepID=A0A1E5UQ39_9POAL|nr:hypothetical protein BAE44_0024000 [Dichanthelium oligosanthes]
MARAVGRVPREGGRLSRDGPNGWPAVLLPNDAGARLVEGTVDAPLVRSMPFKPSLELLRLHPNIDGPVEELVQVQLTRFTCGSLVVGFTAHHHIADG